MHDSDYEGIARCYNGANWQTTNPHYASNLLNFSGQYR